MNSVARVPQLPDPLAELQKRFALLDLGGQLRVVDLAQVARLKMGAKSGDLSLYKRSDANLLMQRFLETVRAPSAPSRVIADFLRDPGTQVFDALAFDPRPTPPTTLNLWVASPVRPALGDWSVIQEFLLEVICAGVQEHYHYLIHYLAHMLQKPEEKPGVMVVLLGRQGTGKGTFFALLKALWPHTTLVVSDVDYILGQFNGCLERAFVVCLDEAMFQGDRKARDRTKSLVTEPQITIEAKFEPRRTIASCHRFFAASNHEHFAQVEADDRRMLFFRVSALQQNSHAYFAALHAAIADPAILSAMVHELLHLSLSVFNVRQRPRSAEHAAQKLLSLQGFPRYWYDVLCTAEFTTAQPWSVPTFVATATLKENCDKLQQGHRHGLPMIDQDIVKALSQCCPSAERKRAMYQGIQQRGYNLPSLLQARREFEDWLGEPIEWPDHYAPIASKADDRS